jgi:putative transposon-encoded protein
MFFSKCGNQSLEGAAFCQKCGSAIQQTDAVTHPTRQTQQPTVQAGSNGYNFNSQGSYVPGEVKPKKNKKKLIIFSIIGVIIAIIIAIAANSGGSIDYVATVKAWTPFGNSGITATYGQVLNKYIDSCTWTKNIVTKNQASVVAKGKITRSGESADITIVVVVTPVRQTIRLQ